MSTRIDAPSTRSNTITGMGSGRKAATASWRSCERASSGSSPSKYLPDPALGRRLFLRRFPRATGAADRRSVRTRKNNPRLACADRLGLRHKTQQFSNRRHIFGHFHEAVPALFSHERRAFRPVLRLRIRPFDDPRPPIAIDKAVWSPKRPLIIPQALHAQILSNEPNSTGLAR